MLSLYADNFRGFSDTLIALERVNFLVGENSTGKTSILSLFSLFQDQTFWFTHDFNTETVSLGYYDEISAPSIPSFRIGYADTESRNVFTGSNDPEPRYHLFEFCNRDNIPTLSKLRARSVSVDFFAVWDGTKLFYRILDTPTPTPPFSDWLHDRAPAMSNLIEAKSPGRLSQRPMMQSFFQIVEEETRQDHPQLSRALWPLLYPHMMAQPMAWIAPIRAKPKRTYDSYKVNFSPEGEHSPYVLKELLTSRGKTQEIETQLKRFGKGSGLFKKIDIHKHGRGKTAPFEIYVQLGNRRFRIANVGYGVAQVLPIIIELLSRPKATWFAIQQPEIHLHPKAQAELGSTMFWFAKNWDDCFFIETHSDFLIDRFRSHMSQQTDKVPETQLLFFERGKNGNSVATVPISQSGGYSAAVPKGFRDFFIKEQLSLLNL
jgi:hypothetical protein